MMFMIWDTGELPQILDSMQFGCRIDVFSSYLLLGRGGIYLEVRRDCDGVHRCTLTDFFVPCRGPNTWVKYIYLYIRHVPTLAQGYVQITKVAVLC